MKGKKKKTLACPLHGQLNVGVMSLPPPTPGISKTFLNFGPPADTENTALSKFK